MGDLFFSTPLVGEKGEGAVSHPHPAPEVNPGKEDRSPSATVDEGSKRKSRPLGSDLSKTFAPRVGQRFLGSLVHGCCLTSTFSHLLVFRAKEK